MYIYVYIYIYFYICLSIYIYVRISTFICISMYIYIYITRLCENTSRCSSQFCTPLAEAFAVTKRSIKLFVTHASEHRSALCHSTHTHTHTHTYIYTLARVFD